MLNENDAFLIETENGQEKVYKLATFKNIDTNKNYIIYTDGKMNSDNKLDYIGSILIKNEENIKIKPLEDDIDISIVNNFINKIKTGDF